MGKRKLRIILRIGPWGFSDGQPIDCIFTNRKSYVPRSVNDIPLLEVTRAEGQALQFVLEDSDLSTRFAEAIKNGKFLELAQNWKKGRFEMHYVPHGKRVAFEDIK